MLTDVQNAVLNFIATETLNTAFQHAFGDSVVDRLHTLAAYAWALYMDLHKTYRLTFSDDMLHKRGVPPTDPEFFRQIHVIEDFVGLVNYRVKSSGN